MVENGIWYLRNFEIGLVERAGFSRWAKLALILNVFGIFCSNRPCNHFLNSRQTGGLIIFLLKKKNIYIYRYIYVYIYFSIFKNIYDPIYFVQISIVFYLSSVHCHPDIQFPYI